MSVLNDISKIRQETMKQTGRTPTSIGMPFSCAVDLAVEMMERKLLHHKKLKKAIEQNNGEYIYKHMNGMQIYGMTLTVIITDVLYLGKQSQTMEVKNEHKNNSNV